MLATEAHKIERPAAMDPELMPHDAINADCDAQMRAAAQVARGLQPAIGAGEL